MAGQIEARWQAYWAEHGTFHSPNPVGALAPQGQVDNRPGPSSGAPKSFVLDMFVGPSGALHVGHVLGYGATDVYARYLRMRGHHVLHAFGFDAFGLPAEQYAVQTGQHPRVTTDQNIATIAGQLRRLGMGYDNRRSVSTTDVPYYRWTQWIFLQIFHSWYDEQQHKARPITDLVRAFESGERRTPDGRPWAAHSEAERRAVVDSRRLAYLDEVPVNWCPALGTVLANEEVTDAGRSERGNFPVFPRLMRQWMLRITAYADRLVDDLDLLDWPESIKAQQRHWIGRTETDVQGDGGAPTHGVSYRMRDWVFSRQRYWGEPFPIVYDEHGPVALPESMLPVELPETSDFAPRTYDPDDADSEPEAPLARLGEWVTVTLDLGDGPREYRRETHTMPQWAGSCWYELRYVDPDNDKVFCDPANERYWMGPQGEVDGGPRDSAGRDPGGVDLYVGGVEHAVLHLLYARFWHKVLYDLGHVSSREPFRRLVTNGYIQAYSYTDSRGVYVPAAEVEERDGGFWWNGRPVDRALGKIGKSLRNMITPDEMCEEYGADTFRVYSMVSGPLRVSRPWDPQGIVGAQRFLQRVWRTVLDEETGATRVTDTPMDAATRSLLHKTIATVRTDMEELAFNTAIARLMELARHATGLTVLPRALAEPMVLMLAPFAPHLAEELWRRLGHPHSLAYEPYPEADPQLVAERVATCVVQVAGRLRDKLEVPVDIGEEELRTRALASSRVQRALAGRPVARVVVRGHRLVNVVPA
ncbi:MAG TPA: class I tRNA ligase family protein [Actinopolymorphaceae bacterium]|nr:class I tRNA ligase family protein [Actinopolymorphaceae bacterium]